MTVVSLVSAKGAPGVTTSAIVLAAVWHGAVLLEANPAGSDLRYWYPDASGAPLRSDLGVVSLLTAPEPWRRPQLTAHLQTLPGGLPVLVGASTPAQVQVLRDSWRYLSDLIGHQRMPDVEAGDVVGPHMVVDAGTLTGPESMSLTVPLLQSSDLTLLVCRSTVASLGHTRELLSLLREFSVPVEALLIAEPSAKPDAMEVLDLPAHAIHLLPESARDATAITGTWTRRLDRSPLLSAARALASQLHQHLGTPPPQQRPSPVPATSYNGHSDTHSERHGDVRIDLRDEVASS